MGASSSRDAGQYASKRRSWTVRNNTFYTFTYPPTHQTEVHPPPKPHTMHNKALDVGKVYAAEGSASFTCCAAGSSAEGTFVLAGCDDGSVVLLEMSPPPADPRACYDLAPGWEKHAHEARKLGRLIPKTSVQLGRKAVAHLVLDVELMRVFVVCDGVVTMCAVELSRRQLRPVGTALEEKKAPLKGVASVCCGVVAGKHVLFAAVKRRVCLFRYTAETLSPLDEVEICNSAPHISLDSQAQVVSMALKETTLCVCTKDEYKLVNLTQGSATVLERKGRGVPLAEACVSHAEHLSLLFLQFGKKTGAVIGSTTHRSGDDAATVVTWSDPPLRIFYLQPFFLLALFADKVGLYSLHDGTDADGAPIPRPAPTYYADQTTQALAKMVAPSTGAGTGRCVFLCSGSGIFMLVPAPFLMQATALAKEGARESVAGAFALLRATLDDVDFAPAGQQVTCHLYKEAGFANLDAGRYHEAFEYFTACHQANPDYLDVREILTLFGLHGGLRKYMSGDGIISQRRNVRDVTGALLQAERKEKMDEAKLCLYRYLEGVRVLYLDPEQPVATVHRAIDTAMLLLYLELFNENTPEADAALFGIMKDGNVLEYETCADELEKRGKLRCLALLKVHNGLVADALQMLYEIGGQQQSLGASISSAGGGASNAGVAETVLALQHCHGEESGLVLEYLPWVLAKDPRAVSALLVPRTPPLDPEKVLALLAPYPDDVIMQYLQFLIDDQQNTEAKYHTRLALIYVEFVQKLMKTCPAIAGVKAGREAGLLGTLRRKLLRLLTKVPSYSSVKPYYDPIRVISHVHGSQMLDELVTLYSYTDEHEAALRVLLYEQKDIDSAVAYCRDQYKKALRRHLIAVFGSRVEDTEKYKQSSLFTSHIWKAPAHHSPADVGEEEEGDEQRIRLDDACARPDEFFAMYTKKLPVGDKHGNVFTGIRRHNAYLFDLLRLCLYPGAGEVSERKTNVAHALQVLGEAGRDLDPLLVFKLLPEDFDVVQVHAYLLGSFRRTTSTLKEIKIHKQLATGNLHEHELNRATLLSRSVLVEYERLCDVCGKRLGNGHLKALPDLQVAHYQCLKGKGHLSPKTNTPFWADMHKIHNRKEEKEQSKQ